MHLKLPVTFEANPREARGRWGAKGHGPVRRRRRWSWLVGFAVAACVAVWLVTKSRTAGPTAAGTAGRPGTPGVPVEVVAVRTGELPVYLTGLGTVTAFNTVTVRSRVDGQLVSVAFQEGQFVHAGDALAEIDPRPFEAQLKQAEGQLLRDLAQLKDARINLERYRAMFSGELISRQQVDTQAALVTQYEGTVRLDQGLIDSAKLQLIYCHITAPISGRIGLRLVDVGNMVHANDQNGLLVITQVQPIAVVFTLPEDALPPVIGRLRSGERLQVEAYDRTGRTRIATGNLLAIDNQIDQTTGTSRLKASFDNADNALFPNQFVNVQLLLDVRANAVIAPLAAIQRGPQGTFVYVVKTDQSVEVRPVTTGAAAGSEVAIDTGLSAGDQVVVDGVDKLRPGSKVVIRESDPGAAPRSPDA